ncbi:hypothetical protein Aab01nite_69470 [Paractinoplanes abujensis]|uniref:DUF2180 family protein n=1 Tax=Paractinoplanes abujensis TaxID=882441 RepID=A0A7W7CW57_9ACTN|nr:hypothetical protein [Actinoplanes abujensis]MBB4695772.1 hypothetical protein [Actinoplanes abujensis]GID23357.1 hypothetical protein Aab01nite_69470 [Actinoplanes abujensis]
MTVKCGINGEDLDEPQIFLCHHCGMPVCEQHGWVVAADDAFAGPATLVSLVEPVSRETGPQPAMHCRNCSDRFHKSAQKRHGWAEPASPVRFPQQAART